jgi:hypothetical protein
MKFDRYVVFTPTSFLGLSHDDGRVVFELDVSDKNLGIAPGLGLMLSMSISDTRKLALALNKKADEAEAQQSRP